MKRFFVFISTGLLTFFLVSMLLGQYHQVMFSRFRAVDVVGTSLNMPAASREQVTRELNKLATESKSVIARRIVEPQKQGKVVFTYAVYGEGKLPEELLPASETSRQTSDLISSYLIVSGHLSSQDLVSTFSQLGYSAVSISSHSLLSLLQAILVNEISMVSLILFVLTFLSLTLIYRIKSLRSAGFKYLSGQTLWNIMQKSFLSDIFLLLMAYLSMGVLGSIMLFLLGIGQLLMFALLWLGLGLYVLVLGVISLALMLTYLLGLKVASLVEVLKGKLPLKRLLVLILMSQLLAILAVGWTVNTLVGQYEEWQGLERAKSKWDQNSDYYHLVYNYGAAFTKGEDRERQQLAWYQLAQSAIGEKKATFVETNLGRYRQGSVNDQVAVTDYLPAGNTIYVSPSYLIEQRVEVSQEFMTKMQNLEEGEFGLIIPEHIANRQEKLESIYKDYMAGFARQTLDASSPQLFPVKAYTSLTRSGQERFLYLTDSSLRQQFLVDPIIVVMTPMSMGNTPNSRLFWEATVANSLRLRDYKATLSLLKDMGVYHWISTLLNSRQSFYTRLEDSRRQLVVLLIGVGLGISTSILLFNSMNLLYFEQFRKEIFIKRLAGLRFVELHANYLSVQALVLIVGLSLLFWFSRQLGLALLTVCLFGLNLLILLYRQNLVENQQAVTVLKGK